MSVLIPEIKSRTECAFAERRILAAVSFGAFFTTFDAGAINAVLPLIRNALGVSIPSVQWVLMGELLLTSGLLLVCGRLGDHIGPRKLYLAGFWVFFCGSVLCSVAPSLAPLIVFRAFAGIGSAMLLSNSPALLATYLRPTQLGSGLGVKLSLLYLGLIAGPIAGGWVAGRFGWRAVFVMETPAALMGLLLGLLLIPRDRPPGGRGKYDLAGACVWVLGFALLVWLIRESASGNLLGTLAAAAEAVLLTYWVLVAGRSRGRDALLLLSSFQNSRFSVSVLSLMFAFMASYVLTSTLAFLLIEDLRESASAAGFMLATYALGRAAMAWVSGRLSDRVEVRLLVIPGLLLFACSVSTLLLLGGWQRFEMLAATLVLAGVGFGWFVAPNNRAIMTSVPLEVYGFGAGVLTTARTLGMTAGVALSGAILSTGGGLHGRAKLSFSAVAVLAVVGAVTNLFGGKAWSWLEARPARAPAPIPPEGSSPQITGIQCPVPNLSDHTP